MMSKQPKCRSCDAMIMWKPHPTTGKLHPFNLDGVSHFSNCPQAEEWRGKKELISREQLELWEGLDE